MEKQLTARESLESGRRAYQQWTDDLMSNPEHVKIYEEEAAKSELWLQLADARHEAGLTQAQMAERLGVSQARVARIEKRGYDAYTLTTLRKYVQALGGGFELDVSTRSKDNPENESLRVAS